MPMYRPMSGAGFAYPLDELRDELDRLWTSLTAAPPLHGWGVRTGSDVFPAVNVSESDDCITIEAELPGLDAGDIDIAMSGEELVLKGARPKPDKSVTSSGTGRGQLRTAAHAACRRGCQPRRSQTRRRRAHRHLPEGP